MRRRDRFMLKLRRKIKLPSPSLELVHGFEQAMRESPPQFTVMPLEKTPESVIRETAAALWEYGAGESMDVCLDFAHLLAERGLLRTGEVNPWR